MDCKENTNSRSGITLWDFTDINLGLLYRINKDYGHLLVLN